MTNWDKESLDLLNKGHFRITDPGPLHAPILGFSIARDDRLDIVLESEATQDAKSTSVQHPEGTVRLNTDQVELINIAGVKGILTGVQTYSLVSHDNASGRGSLKELSKIREATVTIGDVSKVAYAIEWLENLPSSPFIWPNIIENKVETTITRRIAISEDGITLISSDERGSFSSTAAKLTVSGHTIFVCALGHGNAVPGIKPGCIVYVGNPDDVFRKKIRTALSFALGIYLVELGHTLYDAEWLTISSTSRSAYSLDKKAFDLPPMPIASLGSRGFRYDLGRLELSRMVNALVDHYESLDLGNLSWAYWHGCASTVHIAPAHFGAAIEALQRAYIAKNSDKIKKTVLDRGSWKELRASLSSKISESNISDDDKRALKENLNNINQLPQRIVLKSICKAIGIELGSEEDEAWKRRNEAAHGLPIPEGGELAAIRDMKLLRGLFHRILLKITNASDYYVDYASLHHPYRRLEEAVPSASVPNV